MASYRWLSAREHVLERPDTHVGAVNATDVSLHTFVRNGASDAPIRKDITVHVSPALLKVSDEVIVNAIDNHRRDPSQRCIDLSFQADGVFSVFNDGTTIPIALWKGTARYIGEILFGELMSGENFDDTVKRIGGGRNGVGVKIANLMAEWFEITLVNLGDNVIFDSIKAGDARANWLSREHPDQETARTFFQTGAVAVGKVTFALVEADGVCNRCTLVMIGGVVFLNVGSLRYHQRFEKNLSVTHPPTITKTTTKDKVSSTFVKWKVDLPRLSMTAPLDADVMEALKVRAFDAAACTAAKLKVTVNGEKVPFKCLKDYAAAMGGEFLGREFVASETSDASMELCVLSADKTCSVGFVNGLRCSSGTHMDLIFKRFAEAVGDAVGKKLKKRNIVLRPAQLREVLTVVVSVLVINPSFTSQTKEKLQLRPDELGFGYTCSASLLRAMERAGVVDRLCESISANDERAVHKSIKLDRVRVHSIQKYEKALKLGSKTPCSLYITEGDSAKALVVAGFSVIGREHNGVFPLRGKLINVNGLSIKRSLENKEIMHLTQILGLDPHVSYTSERALTLPYRHLVIFTDQDTDGSHIMGLVLNWLQTFYPTLLAALPDFVHRFATPIIRARIGSETRSFFSQVEYKNWLGDRAPTHVKYYKGLGTSNVDDAMQYFDDVPRHRIVVRHTGPICATTMDSYFAASKTNERKQAIIQANPDSFVNYGSDETTYHAFCNDELVHFGIADNRRSLPSAIDGLKPSQRKVIFCCLHRKQGEIKVAQLAAATSERTAYHHGEASLVQTIVAMAQPWMGANNIAMLSPNGMFGSRHMPRTEHSAERYIFTEQRDPVARCMFPVGDDPILEMAEDDGRLVEPKRFCPVIANLLVNGSDGIGYGWKSYCPAYAPLDVIANTRRLVTDPAAALAPMVPGYLGFKGTVINEDPEFVFVGVHTIENDTTIRITELPPKKWTQPYVEWIRQHLVGDDATKHFVTEVVDCSTHDTVDLIVKTRPNANLQGRDLVKDLSLFTRIDTRFLNLFDASDALKQYAGPHDVMRAHAIYRRETYQRRIAHQLDEVRHDYLIAINRARFVREIQDGRVSPSQHTKASLKKWLADNTYYAHDDFKYLEINIFSLTQDLAQRLDDEATRLRAEAAKLEATTPEMVWTGELDRLESAVRAYETEVLTQRAETASSMKKRKRADKAPRKAGGKKRA